MLNAFCYPYFELSNKLLWIVLHIFEHLFHSFSVYNLVDVITSIFHGKVHRIGISKQIFTFGGIDDREGYIINPVLETGTEPQEGGEGCLSVPGMKSDTPRMNWARVRGVDKTGKPLVLEGEGLFARMLQHETDHLHGKLFIDRLIGEDRKRVMRAIRAADYNKVAAQTSAERAMRVGGSFGASLGSFRA